MRKIKFLLFSLFVLCCGLPRLFAAQEFDSSLFIENENSPYRFAEHLPTDAESSLIKPEVYLKNGVWTEDRFVFPGTTGATDLVLSRESLDGKPVELVKFQTFAGLNRRLRFDKVSPGATLVFYFKVTRSNEDVRSKENNSVYVRLYAGRKLVDRLRLSAEDGWTKKIFALHSARFLKQKLHITLEISGDDDASILSLFGYVYG